MSRAIPFEDARQLGEIYDYTRVVIWAYAPGYGQHVTTWGGPLVSESLHAAEAGNAIKRAAGWPESESKALPASLLELVADLDAMLEPHVRSGVLHKGTVLTVMAGLRDVVRERDSELSEGFILARCEAATPGGDA